VIYFNQELTKKKHVQYTNVIMRLHTID